MVDIEYALFDGATRADSRKTVTATLRLTVTENEDHVPATSLSVDGYRFSGDGEYFEFSGDIEMKVGETVVPKITILPENASVKTFEISTSDEEILSVAATSFKALKAGSATVTVSVSDPWQTGGETPPSFTFTVTATEIPITSVEISAGDATLFEGEIFAVFRRVLPGDANSGDLLWYSDDTDVLIVDESGVLTAKSAGTATVTAKSVYDPDVFASVTITVSERAIRVENISLDVSELTLKNGDSREIKATFAPASATLTDLVWESDDEKIATVSAGGVVTAKKKGVTKITATSAIDPNIKATLIVTVKEVVSEKISLSLRGLTAGADGNYTIKSNGSTSVSGTLDEGATVRDITYSSSDERVAKVGADGNLLLTGFGTTIITATTTDGETSTTASLTLTVEKARFSDKINDYFHVIRKAIGHFGAFFVLGLFGAVAYLFFSHRGAGAKTAAFVLCVAAGFAVAGITEICQLPVFTSGRYCSFSDVLLDFNGYALSATLVFAVYAAVQAILAVAKKIKAKKQKS